MATIAQLDEGLATLKGLADAHLKLHERSQRALWQTLAEAYMWWREAVKKEGYLEKQFAKNNITYYNTNKNYPNFNPVVKLVMHYLDPIRERVKINGYATALNAIDDEYIRNSHIYKNRDAVTELVDWMDDKGGILGITGKKVEDEEYEGFDYTPQKKQKRSSKKDDENKKQAQLDVLRLKKIAISRHQTVKTFNIGAVGTGDDDLVLVLAKSTGSGSELKVVGTTAQQSLVDGAVMSIGEVDFANTPSTLRMLCEAIKINTIPKELQSYGARNNFYKKTSLKFLLDDKKPKVRENTRVILRRDGSILVSKSTSEASLTTYYNPREKKQLQEDVWLRGSDRYWIETNLLHDSEIALYDATDLEDQTQKNIQAAKQISLNNTLTKQKRNLYFYDFSRIDENLHYQPCIADKNIQYDWKVEGTSSFFRRLYEQHFNGWMHRVKHRVHIAANNAVAFDVSDDGIMCEKKWSKDDECFMQTGVRYLTAFSDDARVSGNGRILFAPTDIIAVLQMISQHQVHNDLVTMSGNEDLLFIQFENDLAEVQVYIPSCSVTGKRNSKYFKRFTANE